MNIWTEYPWDKTCRYCKFKGHPVIEEVKGKWEARHYCTKGTGFVRVNLDTYCKFFERRG